MPNEEEEEANMNVGENFTHTRNRRIRELKATKRRLETWAFEKSSPAPIYNNNKQFFSRTTDHSCVPPIDTLEIEVNCQSQSSPKRHRTEESRGELSGRSFNDILSDRGTKNTIATKGKSHRAEINLQRKDIALKNDTYDKEIEGEACTITSSPEVKKRMVLRDGDKKNTGVGVIWWFAESIFNKRLRSDNLILTRAKKAQRKKREKRTHEKTLPGLHHRGLSNSLRSLTSKHTNSLLDAVSANDKSSPLIEMVGAESIQRFDWTAESVSNSNSSEQMMTIVLYKSGGKMK